MQKKVKCIALALVMLFVVAFAVACGGSDEATQPAEEYYVTEQPEATPEPTPEPAPEVETEPEPEPSIGHTFGDIVVFDGLEIVFSNAIEWTVLDNQFSDHDGADVIRIPVTITNISDETHGLNMFFYSMFGTAGTQLDDVSAFFMEDDAAWSGDMRSGATLNAYMHFLYDGDGDYFVEFSEVFGPTVEVRLPIVRGDAQTTNVDNETAYTYAQDDSDLENHALGRELMDEVFANIGLGEASSVYRDYVELTNELVNALGISVAEFGLLLLEDFIHYLDGGEPLFIELFDAITR